MEALDWGAIIAAVIALASVITAATPTPKDDHWFRIIRKILEAVALNIGNAKPGDKP